MNFQIRAERATSFYCRTSISAVLAIFWLPVLLSAQLNESCTVSVLNRNISVQPDGTWTLPNIPSNQGRVRARATCIENGITRFGQSGLFTVPTNGGINVVPPIQFGTVTPIPFALALSAPQTLLDQVGATVQIAVTGTYANGTTANLSTNASGTDYTSSNPLVASVSPNGVVTAIENGSTLITAFNEGTSGFITITVGTPPSISISSPVNGTTVIQGANVTVVMQVTGGPIAAVTLSANGQVVGTVTSPPYQIGYVVATGLTSVTFTATVTDTLGHTANAAPVVIQAIVDPLTKAVGTVVNQSNTPVAGASVSCLGVSGTTDSNGNFSIAGVPTAQNSVVCLATFTDLSGLKLSGTSAAVPPVRHGTTDVGKIVLGSLSSRGTDFWMAFQNYPAGNGAQLVILSETPASFSISSPGFSTSGKVSPQSPQTITLPNSLEITSNQTVETKGIHLTSDAEITASFFYSQDGTHDAYLAIPSSSLGTEYFAASYIGGPAEFVITAPLDSTHVSVTPSCQSIAGTPAGSTINLVLNQGQTYQYECNGDVTGSHIVSAKPVSVVSGNGCTFIPVGSAVCDIASEMMFPVASLYGTDFYPVAFLDTSVRILAARDNTSVTVDDGFSKSTYSLGSGQFKEIQNGNLGFGTYHVTSNNPITIVQFGGRLSAGQGVVIGGPNSMQILPTGTFKSEYRILGAVGLANFVIIIAPNSAVPSIQANGAPIQGPLIPLPGGLYQWIYLPIFGQTVVTANAPIGVYSIGLGISPQGSYAVPVAF